MLAQPRVLGAVPGPEQGVELSEQVRAMCDSPVSGEHVRRRLHVRHRQDIHRVAVAQRVGDRRGEQTRADVDRQGFA